MKLEKQKKICLKIDRSDLERLVRKWLRMSKQYSTAGHTTMNPSDARRYEGESIALRWCAEDLNQLVDAQNSYVKDRFKE